MSHSLNEDSGKEEDRETPEGFVLIDMSDDVSNNDDSDNDLEPIEPYSDDDIKPPLYNIYPPTDTTSARITVRKKEVMGKSEAGTSKDTNKQETSNTGEGENSHEDIWVEITPQMIVTALKNKSTKSFEEITGYISCHYPVDNNGDELEMELANKLRCACHLGFVKKVNQCYRLTVGGHEKLHLTKSDQRTFWKSYNRMSKNVRKEKRFGNGPRKSECLEEKKLKRKHEQLSKSSSRQKVKPDPPKTKKHKVTSDAPTSQDVTSTPDLSAKQDENRSSSPDNKN